MSENNKELTVRQVIALLEKIAGVEGDDCKVGIPYSPGHATIGASPLMGISGIHAGFDWNKGCVFLTTVGRLGTVEDDLIEEMKRRQNAEGMLIMEMRRCMRDANMSEAEKLARMEEIVSERVRMKPKDPKAKSLGQK